MTSICNDKYLSMCIIQLNVVADANFECPYVERTNYKHPEEISHTEMPLISTEIFVSDIRNVNCSTDIYNTYPNTR
jgi:hypothetical protein